MFGMIARTKLTVAYLGGGFSGWQRQNRGRTVQGELENAIRKLTGGISVAVVGAGRTDAGVHAAAQAAHLDLPVAIPPEALPRLLNARLAADLRVRSARAMPGDFHAIACALGKHYAYRIMWRDPELPWLGLRAAVLPPVTESGALEELCRRLPGRRDWASFTVPEAARRGAVRTIHRVQPVWLRSGLEIHVIGEGFLRYQVRRMVGALLEVGRGRMNADEFFALLDHPSHDANIPTAPAKGLTLERVYYRASPRLSSPGDQP